MVKVSVNDADDSQPTADLSPGKILLRARLLAKLTQEQVAKELYVTVYKIQSLETDDYTQVKSDTFARGYIRAYANLVKADVVDVLAAYDALMDRLQPKNSVQMHVAAENNHRGAWQFLVVIGAFFISLWLISVWFFDNHSDEQYVVAVATSSSAKAQSSKSSAQTNFTSAAFASETSVASTSQGATNLGAVVKSTNVTAQSSSAKKASLDTLSFSFREESWLEVSDSRGDVLATELEFAGSKLTLEGVAPFDVKLGNASAVDIYLNGKKKDVIPSTGSNVLTLKIGD